ncbi:MAG TPA: DUF4386 domain-containing protein [Nocardioidaceae bacterium]|nr:DUF4386 domain-containing protein [Nocardioidaceae bacterium]
MTALDPRLESPRVAETDLTHTARTTGLLYLGFFVTGILGSLVVRGQIYDADAASATLANLVEHEWLARVGIALELAIVLAQALTALWFYRLFRRVDTFAAGSLAVFGMVNAVAILVSAGLLATAVDVSNDPSLGGGAGRAATVQLLYVASGHLWGVAALFFGLWLIPMAWLVIHSGWLPRTLGWVLGAGGVGYVVSAFVTYLVDGATTIAQLLTLPSVVGELWIMGYLIVVARPDAAARPIPAQR